ncbi:MAG: hypothetical protein N2V75_00775, partial [Methanophagales archaeon]|nr:hypothetical protein [Methanophagales archaeon]
MSRELQYVKELPALTEEQKELLRKLGIEPEWWWVEGAKTGIGIGEFFYGFSPPAVSAGETIYCVLIVVAKNFIPLGDPLKGYFGIKYDDTEITRVEQEFYGLTPAITAGSFTMPDKDVTVTFFGGHEKEETTFWGTHRGTGEWVEDFSIKVTLKRPIKAPPRPPPKEYPPRAILQITPSKGNMCTTFKLDAKKSYSPVRLISAYKYDVEGDGKFEKYRIPERWVGFPWSYIKPGIFYPTLQVIDEKGYTDLDRKKIEVFPYYPLYLRFVDMDTKKPIIGAKITIKGPDKIEWDYKEFLSRTPEYEVPKDQIPKYIIPRPAADSKIVELYSGYTSEKKLRIGGPQRAGWRYYPPEVGIGTFVFPVEGVENPPQYNIEYIYEFSHPDYGKFVGKIKHTEECYVIREYKVPRGVLKRSCTQSFKVCDMATGLPIAGAKVVIRTTVFITDEKGELSHSLIAGKSYTAHAEAAGYKKSPDRSFTACTEKPIIFYLEKLPWCMQTFVVIDKATREPIAKAKIVVDGITVYTDEKGEATTSLTIGRGYTAHAEALHYEKSPDKKFTACTEKPIVFELTRKKTCTQSFKVGDMVTGLPIAKAKIVVDDTVLVTDEKGEASTSLSVGKGYTTHAEAAGYKKSPDKSFTACTVKPIIFWLEKLPPEMCTQSFVVTDKATGEPIAKAKVVVDGITVYTDEKGEATTSLTIGRGYTAHAEALHYEKSPDKKFTACTEKPIVFELTRKKTCTQSFKVGDMVTGLPIAKAKIVVDDTVLVTDEKGEASTSLSVGKGYTTHAEAAGYKKSPDKSFTACTVKPIIFWLEKLPPEMCTQAFKVVDKETGKPLQGIALSIIDSATDRGFADVITDEKGEASATLVLGHEYYILTSFVKTSPVLLLYRTPKFPVFTACTEKPMVLGLEPRYCTQAFKVIDKSTRVPIKGAEVNVFGKKLTTDVKGEASIELPRGGHFPHVFVDAAGYRRLEKSITACTEKPVVFELEKKPIKPPPKVPPKTCTQLFKVETEEGKPISGAKVIVKGWGTAHTDAEGNAQLTLTEGTTYTAVAEKEGYECVECEKTFTACTPKRLVFILKKVPLCTQSFVVTDKATGTAIRGAKVVVNSTVLTTDEKGVATTSLVVGKGYTAHAEALYYEKSPDKKFTACTEEPITFELSSTCKQSFEVKDKVSGGPIAGAKIVVNSTTLTANMYGKASTTLITGTKYTAHAEAVNYHKSPDKSFIACEKPIIIFELLPKGCRQLFKVETEEGEPVGAATITIKGVGKKITDAEGKTSFTLTEGTTYTAVAEKEGYECVECEKTFTACTPKRLVFIL